MEITEINKIISDTENKINELKAMLADYDACKNATSKTYLLAAISKIATPLKPQTIAR